MVRGPRGAPAIGGRPVAGGRGAERLEDEHGGGERRGQARPMGRGGEHDRRAGVGEELGEPGRRIGRVEREIGGAGLEGGQHGDDEGDGAVEREAHEGLGPTPWARRCAARAAARASRAA